MLAGADANVRRQYDLRAARSEPGLEPGPERPGLQAAAEEPELETVPERPRIVPAGGE